MLGGGQPEGRGFGIKKWGNCKETRIEQAHTNGVTRGLVDWRLRERSVYSGLVSSI